MAALFATKTNRAMPAFIRSVIRATDNVLKGTAAPSASRDLLVKMKPCLSHCKSYFKSLKEKRAGWWAGQPGRQGSQSSATEQQ